MIQIQIGIYPIDARETFVVASLHIIAFWQLPSCLSGALVNRYYQTS